MVKLCLISHPCHCLGRISDCCNSDPTLENIVPDDTDVLEEENEVKQQMRSRQIDPNIAVQIQGLVKIYPGKLNLSCCKFHKTEPFHSIKVSFIPSDNLNQCNIIR